LVLYQETASIFSRSRLSIIIHPILLETGNKEKERDRPELALDDEEGGKRRTRLPDWGVIKK